MNIRRFFCALAAISFLSIGACSDQSGEAAVLPEVIQAEVPSQAVQLAPDVVNVSVNASGATSIAMDVYKSPTCGCCGKWVSHAEQRGFSLTTHHPEDLNKLKIEHGIGPEYQSCHTSISAEGYVFEGHIPARYIHQFLAAPPAGARGLVVPAMPMGSPGMEVEDRFMPYAVLLLKSDGNTEVFAEVTTAAQQYQ